MTRPPAFLRACALGLTLLAGGLPSLLAAQGEPPPLPPALQESRPPPPPPAAPSPEALREQLVLLERLLQLSPEELARMRQTIVFIESLAEPERAALLQRLRSLVELDPQSRQQLQELQPLLPAEKYTLLEQWWRSLTLKERTAFHTRLQETEAAERTKILEERLERFAQQMAAVRERMRSFDSSTVEPVEKPDASASEVSPSNR